MDNFRLEHDCIGEVWVKKDAYYGANSVRALENFNITGYNMDRYFIEGIVNVKKACAIENEKVGLLTTEKKDAIVIACDKLLNNEYIDNIIVDPIQGGAGTSFNMNINEVIANIGNEILGGELGIYDKVHPNDDVNKGQSTNDVIPTAAKIAMIRYFSELIEETKNLIEALEKKGEEFKDIIKMGRTQLQDAVPISLGQEFYAYSHAIKRDLRRFDLAVHDLSFVNMGGTAIGTGLNADLDYVNEIVPVLAKITELNLNQCEDLIDGTQNLDGFLFASSVLKTFAATLSKMSNDLRLMSSGPQSSVGDIKLPPRQAGSSIMPGKVNPVIPEVVNQVAFSVFGNDMTVAMAVEAGQLELNAFEPIIFYKTFESLKTLKNAIYTLRVNCIDGIEANVNKLEQDVEQNIGLVTALAPYIGYEMCTKIAHEARKNQKTVREVVLENNIMTAEELDKVLDFKNMIKPGIIDEEHIRLKKIS